MCHVKYHVLTTKSSKNIYEDKLKLPLYNVKIFMLIYLIKSLSLLREIKYARSYKLLERMC